MSSSPPDGTNGDRTERERAARGHRRGPFGRFEWTVLLIAAFVALAVLVERRVHPDPLPGFRFVETGVVDLPVIGQQVVATGGRAVGTALEQHGVTVRPSHQAGPPAPSVAPPHRAITVPTARVESISGPSTAGGRLHVNVLVQNPNDFALPVGLGMTLVPLDGRPMFSDPAHDLVRVSLVPGDSVLQRLFDIPVSTPAGQYGVWLALYDSFPQHTPDHIYADLGMYRFLLTVR